LKTDLRFVYRSVRYTTLPVTVGYYIAHCSPLLPMLNYPAR